MVVSWIQVLWIWLIALRVGFKCHLWLFSLHLLLYLIGLHTNLHHQFPHPSCVAVRKTSVSTALIASRLRTHALISYIYIPGGGEIWYMLRESKTCVRFNNRATHPHIAACSLAYTHTKPDTRQSVINNFALNYPCKFALETNLHFTHTAPPVSLTAPASCHRLAGASLFRTHAYTFESVKGDELYVITRRECSLDEIRHYSSHCTLQTLIRWNRFQLARRHNGVFVNTWSAKWQRAKPRLH